MEVTRLHSSNGDRVESERVGRAGNLHSSNGTWWNVRGCGDLVIYTALTGHGGM